MTGRKVVRTSSSSSLVSISPTPPFFFGDPRLMTRAKSAVIVSEKISQGKSIWLRKGSSPGGARWVVEVTLEKKTRWRSALALKGKNQKASFFNRVDCLTIGERISYFCLWDYGKAHKFVNSGFDCTFLKFPIFD